MSVFYTKKISGNTAFLDEQESHHCTRVLRLGEGSPVRLIDGNGGYYEGLISSSFQGNVSVTIQKRITEYGKKDYNLHVAIALTKNNDRFEWFLEKSTEIGIDRITPLICQRSERRTVRRDRMEKVILAAMKQSINAYLPVLDELRRFEDFISLPFRRNLLIAHCSQEEKTDLRQLIPDGNEFTIVIGPEGDFSVAEIGYALTKGYKPVSLGISRMRTETAGVAACQIISDLVFFNSKRL